MATAKEIAMMHKIQNEMKNLKPIGDKELEQMEATADAQIDGTLSKFKEVLDAWNGLCHRTQILAEHNVRIIAEVRRLQSVLVEQSKEYGELKAKLKA